MSIVASIIARLKEVEAPVFALVEGAAEFVEVKDQPMALPAAYVITRSEASGDNERMTGPVLQRMESDIAVVIVTANLTDYRGAAASADIETLKSRVRRRLIGFVPEGSDEPIVHVSGELVKARSGTVWFEEIYAAAAYLQEEA